MGGGGDEVPIIFLTSYIDVPLFKNEYNEKICTGVCGYCMVRRYEIWGFRETYISGDFEVPYNRRKYKL